PSATPPTTPTGTQTATSTATHPPTSTTTSTPTLTTTVTNTPTLPPTKTPSATSTATPTATGTPSTTATPSDTPTATATDTPVSTPAIPVRGVYRSYPRDPIQFAIGATDPQGTPLHYSVVTALPAGAELDALSGMFSWTPGSDQIGPVYVPFIVT